MHLVALTTWRRRRRTTLLKAAFTFLSGIGLFLLVERQALPVGSMDRLFPGRLGGTPEPVREPNLLSGRPVVADLARRRPLSVMVENHPQARPQSGLPSAAHVYEALTEGGITRFMVVYSDQDAAKVGPVRSARQYFVEWAKGLDALYAHVGGSQDALHLIRSLSVADLDQFRYGTRAFRRELRPGVAVEHTVFTSTTALYDLAQRLGFDLTSRLAPYRFQDDPPPERRGPPSKVTIDFSTPTYRVTWTYDPSSNTYARSQAGAPHRDRETGVQLTAKTVALVVVTRQARSEGAGYHFVTTGQGRARLFRDGQQITAVWRRPSVTDSLRLFGEDGAELPCNRGQTWIEVVHPDTPVTVE